MRPDLRIMPVPADAEPARSLLAEMTDELDELYARVPGTLDSIPATPDQMSPPQGCFLVISVAEEAIACGGVKRLDPSTAEIKRMYVRPAHRGGGVGAALLAALEAECSRLGYPRVRLDTGPEQPVAKRIYERAGYREIPDYNGNPYAAFWFEKELGGSVGEAPGADPSGAAPAPPR
jgi:GNAT superfamily N-acetyltransferase